ncbi:UEV-domain-containing protein [Aaosphaeria arxii CBS 175.79]|uniref:UEV-domain-containing protein n=1 Tax=Aaosphaeria arxii CBS 175.79 TaxID=1450172 RepID=A0A6A5XPM4_9PLEO|nr:UEV-domain-containing protein [Aaosphaeria arxii CBS 175.79]KAF2014787.1 UEV-domain-containing protein [Aaosphaeria arxii CBS 175.79]
MAGVPEKVLNWLYSVLPSEYPDVNRTYHDVTETLANYPSLSPRTEVYTYENGVSALLLLLSGTLPVTFRGATYGFPVAIWIPHAYPRESPIVYITPSQDMVVRPGQHVSGDGRVYHPYLAQWGKYWDKSTIFDFLAVLRGVFAKEPPVRSKQQQYNAPDQQAAPPRPPPPPTGVQRPVEPTNIASPLSRPSSQAPAPPPKPPKPYKQNQSTPQPRPEGRYSQPPPLPPHPPQPPQSQYQQQYQHQPQRKDYGVQHGWQQPGPSPPPNIPQQQMGYDRNPPTPGSKAPHPRVQATGSQIYQDNSYQVGSPVSPLTPEDQQHKARYQQGAPMPQVPSQANHSQYQPQYQAQHPSQQQQQQYGAPHLQQQQPQYSQGPPQQQRYQQQYQQQPPYNQQHGLPPPPQQQQAPPAPKPPINLLDDSLEVTLPSQTGSQPSIPVPPVPPNPEKDALLTALSQTLCTQIRQTVSSNASAIAPLRGQQSALQNAHARLQSELEQLQQLDAALASNEKILRDAMVEADRVMGDARTRKVPDVDDVLVAPTVVGGQLYVLAAEERGIADALFVLGRGLDKGRVGADVFVKQTRSLAREQFLKKALIKKIAKGMALDDYQMR